MVALDPTTYTPSAEALLRELEADASPDKPAQYALQQLDWLDVPGRPGWHQFVAGRTLLVLEFSPGEYGYRRVLAYGHADRTAVITRDEALLFLAAHLAEKAVAAAPELLAALQAFYEAHTTYNKMLQSKAGGIEILAYLDGALDTAAALAEEAFVKIAGGEA